LVEAMRYKSGGHGFDFKWSHWDFSFGKLSAKRTSPFKFAGGGGGPVQSTTGSRGVRISGTNGSNAGYTMF